MPAFSLTTVAQGVDNTWTLGAGGDKPTAVSTSDGDTSFIRVDADTADTFTMTALPADAATISGSVTFTINAKDTFNAGGLTVYTRARYSGNVTNSAHTPTASYADYSDALATAPGGSAWTVAIVNATEAGVLSGGAGNRISCSYVAMSGTYLQAGEMWVSIYNLVGPLIGSSLLFPQLVSAARSLAPRIVCSPEELRTAWHQYKDKSFKFPSYHFMGA